MSHTSISVVIPCYNKAPFVSAAVESVLGQNSPPDHVILVDDGSTDHSAKIIAQAFPSVTLIQQPNRGVAAARNRGVDGARSEWISFLDSDDLWLPDHLAETRRTIEAFPSASLISTAHREVRGASPPALEANPAYSSPRLIRYLAEAPGNPGCVWTSSATVRREAFLELGGFRRFRTGEDTDLWVRLSLVGLVAISDRVTALYRRGVGGVIERLERENLTLGAPGSLGDLHPCSDLLLEHLHSLPKEDELLRHEILGFLAFLVERRSRQAFSRGDLSGFRDIYSLRPEDAPSSPILMASMARLPLPLLALLHRVYRVSRAMRLRNE